MTFLDIFSNNKVEKNKKKYKIIADHREKNSLVCSELVKLGLQVEFEQLAVADYLIDNTAVERKTISDFKSSIVNKRIMQQLQEIKQYKKSLLIIEGITDKDLYEGIIHENAFRGFLLSVAINYQVPIIYTLDSRDTAIYLSLLAKKSSKKEFSFRPSKIALSTEEQLQFILEGFPHIGPVNAKKLLVEFKTIQGVASASCEEIERVIGKKGQLLYELLHYSYKDQETG